MGSNGHVASRTESEKKINNFSNFKSVVSKLCRISREVIEAAEGHRGVSKLRIFS